jgi:hypothetical protein
MPIQSLYDLIDAAILFVPLALGVALFAMLVARNTFAH